MIVTEEIKRWERITGLFQFLMGMILQDFLSYLYLNYKTFHKIYKFLSKKSIDDVFLTFRKWIIYGLFAQTMISHNHRRTFCFINKILFMKQN